MRITVAFVGLAASVSMATACASAGREALWEKEQAEAGRATTTSTAAAASLSSEADAHWAKRDDRAELETAIETWEKQVEADPDDANAMVKLSRALYFLADGFLALDPDVDEESELAVYTRGVNHGEAALMKLEPDFAAAMRADGDFEEAIRKIGPAGMPAAYWYCVNLGRFATKKGLSVRLYYKDKIKAAMETVMKLDPRFYYGAADRYFGAFYSVLPSIAGKDVDKSRDHFTKSLELAPEYLPTKVVKAQFLAVELDDENMYKALLDEVINGEETDNPDIVPENRAAKRTAKKMLSEIDEVF